MEEQLLPIQWKDDALVLLDQTLLPNEVVYESFKTAESVWDAIQVMKVRGAPAIGVSAAYGVYLGAKEVTQSTVEGFIEEIKKVCAYLATSRPTAVNLFWALERMESVATDNTHLSIKQLKDRLLEEAKEIHREDEEINRQIGEHALTVFHDGMGVLTHCNAGALATTKYGTATAPMYLAKEKGWDLKIYSDETRLDYKVQR